MDDTSSGGRVTPAAPGGGSKPTTPVPPSPPTSTHQSSAQSSISSPSPTPPASTPVTSHVGVPSRYGYGHQPQLGPPNPGIPMHQTGPQQPPPYGPPGTPNTAPNMSATNHSGAMGGPPHHGPPPPHSHPHAGGYAHPPPPPHQMMGGQPPPPGHHHHHSQYMPPMMMPPPSQYPNKTGPPPPQPIPPPGPISHVPPPANAASTPPHTQPPPHQQHVPPYGNYGPHPPPPPRMSGVPPPLPPHHSGAGQPPPSAYYPMRHQMPPHQPPHPQMSAQQMSKNYGYPNNVTGGGVGYPGPNQPNTSQPSPHMPPHPHHPHGAPPSHHPHHPSMHSNNPMMASPHSHHPSQQQPPQQQIPPNLQHAYGPSLGSHANSESHGTVNNNAVNNASTGSSSQPSSNTMNNNSGSVGNASNNANNSNTSSSHSSSNGNLRLPQPPAIMDEVSQTSTASSQAADDSCASSDMISSHKHTNTKHHLSHPPTPNTSNLGSPGAASLSSYHDDFDSVSSPSWPRTPASPALNSSQYEPHVHSSKRPDNVQKLYEMSDEPERKVFLDKYFQFLDERATPLNQVPTISKIPVDLYRLYMLVKERGGYLEVTRSKMWKDCAQLCNIANSSSASYTLRKQYMKHLLPFECKFDRGGIDVGPLLSAADATNVNRKKSANSKLPNSGRSTPTTPRLSPNDSPGPPYHHSHHPGMHPGYEMDPSHQQNTYPTNPNGSNSQSASYHPGGPHSYPPPHAEYHNSQYAGQSTAAPPPPPTSSAPNQNNINAPNHESISVKDPFSDEDQISTPRVPKSSASSYPPPPRPHYSMPNNSGMYYGQGPPPSQNQNAQPPSGPHSNTYPPEAGVGTGHYHDSPYTRSSSATPDSGQPPPPPPTSAAGPYGSRMGMNGPVHYHGSSYYGSYQQPPPPASYGEQASAPPPGSSPAPPGHQRPGVPYEHHAQHSAYPPPPVGHRYPTPNVAAGAVPPNNYPTSNRAVPPHPPPGSTSGAYPTAGHHGVPPGPPPAQSQPSYPGTNTPGSQDGNSGPYPPPSQGVKNQESYNSAVRMSSALAQRLLGAKLPLNPPSSTSNSSGSATAASNNTANSSNTQQQNYPAPPQQYGSANTNNTSANSSPTPTPVGPPPSKPPTTSMQANTNISWMSSSPSPSVRYTQPKRHPDFAKQTPSDAYPPSSQQHYSNASPAASSPRVVAPPPPGSSPPNAAGPMWTRDSQYRMPSAGPGGFYGHPNYQNNTQAANSSPTSGSHPHSSQRDSWHDSRQPPIPPSNSAPSNNSMDSPMTTAHWSSNRYSGSGHNAPYQEGYANSQSNHYPSSSGPSSAPPPPNSSKIIPPPTSIPQYGGVRPEQNSRSNYMSTSGSMSHSHSHPGMFQTSKLSIMNPGWTPTVPYGPYTSGPHNSSSSFSNSSSSSPSHHTSSIRRETLFPPDSVEATVPTPSKRRKLMARDILPVEAWRIYMSLKSGLLAESTFALDVLSVYSNDDNTLIYLSLPNMPGLLEVLLEHYRRYLNEIFNNIFEDIEIGYENKVKQGSTNDETDGENLKKNRQLKWYELDRDLNDSLDESDDDDDEDIEQLLEKKFKLNGKRKLTLFDSSNYTNITRSGKPVKVKKDKNLFIMDHEKAWDPTRDGFSSGQEHWLKGGGETTTHIQSHMEPKEKYLRFCRLIKSKKEKEYQNQNDDCQMTNGDHQTTNGDDETDKFENDLQQFLDSENDYPKIHPTDRERYWKRMHQPDFEDESYDQEEPAVCTGREYQDSIKSRCLTVSNLIRNLTFVPGNDLEMCKSPCLLLILSRLILLYHVHAVKRKRKISEIDCTKISANKLDEETMFDLIDEKPEDRQKNFEEELPPEKEWWWESLHLIRENTMVTLANISGQLDMSTFSESITLSLLDGLLHWAICPSSYAQDAFPSAPNTLSPRRLAYETLSKLSIYESNVDLILATPPWSRIEKFLKNLTKSLVRNEDQTIREFSIVLISNFATADPSVVRVIALSGYAVTLLLGFIEQAEQSAMNMANSHGIQYLKENFDAIGTTPDMVRRAAAILRSLARYSENRSQFIQHEPRLLSLSMSQILDPSISTIIADILYECSFESSNPINNNNSSALASTPSSSSSSLLTSNNSNNNDNNNDNHSQAKNEQTSTIVDNNDMADNNDKNSDAGPGEQAVEAKS